MSEYRTKLLIIGSGPAGYTASIYAARAGLEPILVSGHSIGGQLTITSEIENFPGFPEPILGSDLMQRMRQQALNLNVQIVDDIINYVDFSQKPFILMSENNTEFYTDSVIIATGATARFLGLPSEKKFTGFGVSICATCDGFFYKNKDVVVIGGGNKAVTEALHLAKIANSVTLIHRRDVLTAEKILQEKLFQEPRIKFEWDSVVEEFLGTENPPSLSGLKIKNVKTDKIKEIKTDGVFISIGRVPQTDLFKNQLELDKSGYIITDVRSAKTSIKGVFAAGDVQNPNHQQAIIAAGSGCLAALEAQDFLNKIK